LKGKVQLNLIFNVQLDAVLDDALETLPGDVRPVYAGLRPEMRNRPWLLVAVVATMPVPTFVNETDVPRTTAPVESVITPVTVALVACEWHIPRLGTGCDNAR